MKLYPLSPFACLKVLKDIVFLKVLGELEKSEKSKDSFCSLQKERKEQQRQFQHVAVGKCIIKTSLEKLCFFGWVFQKSSVTRLDMERKMFFKNYFLIIRKTLNHLFVCLFCLILCKIIEVRIQFGMKFWGLNFAAFKRSPSRNYSRNIVENSTVSNT